VTEVPEPPDEFETKEELVRYIEQLQDQIDSLEEELEESGKDALELREELDEIKRRATSDNRHKEATIEAILGDIDEKIEEVEAKQKDRGDLNSEVVDTIEDITGNQY